MTNVFFTSDLHFFHGNRPGEAKFRGPMKWSRRSELWADVDEMNHGLIEMWNAKVAPGDEVHVVGDFSFGKLGETLEVFRQLNGNKHLVRGNHDWLCKKAEFNAAWASVCDLRTVKVADPDARNGKQRIVLCHYAMRVWNESHHGAWMLHGHSHGNLQDGCTGKLRSMDVGVDNGSPDGPPVFAPWSYDEVKARMLAVPFQPVDHHGVI